MDHGAITVLTELRVKMKEYEIAGSYTCVAAPQVKTGRPLVSRTGTGLFVVFWREESRVNFEISNEN